MLYNSTATERKIRFEIFNLSELYMVGYNVKKGGP